MHKWYLVKRVRDWVRLQLSIVLFIAYLLFLWAAAIIFSVILCHKAESGHGLTGFRLSTHSQKTVWTTSSLDLSCFNLGTLSVNSSTMHLIRELCLILSVVSMVE